VKYLWICAGLFCLLCLPLISKGQTAQPSNSGICGSQPLPSWYYAGFTPPTPFTVTYNVNGAATSQLMSNVAIGPSGPCHSTNVWIVTPQETASPSSVASPIVPQVALWNGSTNALATPATQVDSRTVDPTNTHDNPSIYVMANGCIYVGYGAAATYSGYNPPAAWKAFSSSGTAGSGNYAEPMNFGCSVDNTTNGFLNSSNQLFFPGVGVSEMAAAQNCDTAGCISIGCGQDQTTTVFSIIAGQSNCFIARITSNTPGLSSVSFDTQCGLQVAGTATSSLCNGHYVPTDKPYSDGYYEFAITSSPSASGQTYSFNPPGGPACSSAVGVTSSGSGGTTAATNMAAAYNADANCPTSTYTAYAANDWTSCSGGCVMFGYEAGDPRNLSSSPGNPTCTAGTGTIGCGSTTLVQGANTNSRFVFGGIAQYYNGYWYLLLDVQPDTTSPIQTSISNSFGEGLAIFRLQPLQPTGMQVCDVSGNNCYNINLGSSAQTTYALLGAGGGGSCTASADCSEPGTPTVATWCTVNCTDSGHVSPFLVRPCNNTPPTYFPGSGKAPFVYNWSFTAQAADYVNPLSQTSAKSMAIGNDGYAHIVWLGQNTNSDTSLFEIAVNLTTKTSTCSTIATSADAVQMQGAVGMNLGRSGELYALLAIGDGANFNATGANCTGKAGLCIMEWTSTSTGSWSSGSILTQISGTDSVSTVGSFIPSQDGTQLYGVFVPGSNASCYAGATCKLYLEDYLTP
jgi:hypothetical protein